MIGLSQKQFPSSNWLVILLLIGGIVISISLISFGKVDLDDSSDLASPIEKNPRVDMEADKTLKSMANYLESLKQFSFNSKGYFDYVIDSTGQKIQMNNQSEMYVKRPNKFRVNRKGDITETELYYDGKQVSLYGKKLNFYAQEKAPSEIDKAIDFIRDVLGIEAPAGDLLYTDVYEGLMADVISGDYIGKSIINGISCHHLAYRGNEIDWQLWIEDGPNPLPRKYLIVSKLDPAQPEFSIEIEKWNTNAKIDDSYFSFKPLKSTAKVDFFKGDMEIESKTNQK